MNQAMSPRLHADSSDAKNTFGDLSGTYSAAFSNPFKALIEACQDDSVRLRPIPFYQYIQDLSVIVNDLVLSAPML